MSSYLNKTRIEELIEEIESSRDHCKDVLKFKEEQEEYQKNESKPEIKPDNLAAGWFIYIFVMIGGLIFNDYILLAIFATIYFFIWRKRAYDIANGRIRKE